MDSACRAAACQNKVVLNATSISGIGTQVKNFAAPQRCSIKCSHSIAVRRTGLREVSYKNRTSLDVSSAALAAAEQPAFHGGHSNVWDCKLPIRRRQSNPSVTQSHQPTARMRHAAHDRLGASGFLKMRMGSPGINSRRVKTA